VAPNPETRAQFAQRMLRRVLVGQVRQWEQQVAVEAARATVTEIEVA
jgi:hypothetical protein